MSRLVFVTMSHLKARVGKNKGFRNTYLCGVLKHSKIKRCIAAGQWKRILANNTISWAKRHEWEIWTSTGKYQQLMIPYQTGSDCFQFLSEGEDFSSLGGLYKGHVGGAGLISPWWKVIFLLGKDSRMRRAVGCLHWLEAMDLVFQHVVGTINREDICATVFIGGLCHKDTSRSSKEQLSLALPNHSCLHGSALLLSLGLRRDPHHFWDTTAGKQRQRHPFSFERYWLEN